MGEQREGTTMQVFLAVVGFDWEGADTVGVFATAEEAEVSARSEQRGNDYARVEQWEVGSSEPGHIVKEWRVPREGGTTMMTQQERRAFHEDRARVRREWEARLAANTPAAVKAREAAWAASFTRLPGFGRALAKASQ
jgi:hypothetical protein